MIEDDVRTVARVVAVLGRELEGLSPELCSRIGRALAAAFPELGLSPLASPLPMGDRGDAVTPPSVSPIAPVVISSSDSLGLQEKEDLSPPLGRAREGDTGTRHPSSPLSPPEWERETRVLLSVDSDEEWRAVRAEVRRQLHVGLELARGKGLAVSERLDVNVLETAAVRLALERSRKKAEAGDIGSPAAYLGVVVRGAVGDVLRYRARKALRRRETRARERGESDAERALAQEAEAAAPLGRAGLQQLKGLASVEPSSVATLELAADERREATGA